MLNEIPGHFAERHFADGHFVERHFAELTIYMPNNILPTGHFCRTDY